MYEVAGPETDGITVDEFASVLSHSSVMEDSVNVFLLESLRMPYSLPTRISHRPTLGWRRVQYRGYTQVTQRAMEGGYKIKVRSLAYFGHSRLHAFSAAVRI